MKFKLDKEKFFETFGDKVVLIDPEKEYQDIMKGFSNNVIGSRIKSPFDIDPCEKVESCACKQVHDNPSNAAYSSLSAAYDDLTELLFGLLINKNISIDMIPSELRIKNRLFYRGAYRGCCYLKSDKDFLNYYTLLKCIHDDIDNAKIIKMRTEGLQRLFVRYHDEAMLNKELKKYVLKKAKKDRAKYLYGGNGRPGNSSRSAALLRSEGLILDKIASVNNNKGEI